MAENVMPPEHVDYLTPDVTMGWVFADLYARGDALANDLEERIIATGELYGERVPGTPIDLNFSGGRNTEDETWATYRWITAGGLVNCRGLYQLSDESPIGGQEEPQEPAIPTQIDAFRSTDSSVPAYSLQMRADRLIVCAINPLLESDADDEPDTSYDYEEPYIGVSEHDSTDRVVGLDDYERKRLHLIANAIAIGIVRTEMLRDGADFHAMFDIEPVSAAPPKRRFSLNGLLRGGRRD